MGAPEGDAWALYRAMISDLQYKLNNPVAPTGPRQPWEPVPSTDPNRSNEAPLKNPVGPAEAYEFRVLPREGLYAKRPEGGVGEVLPEGPPPKLPPDPRKSRSGGFSVQEPSHEETRQALEEMAYQAQQQRIQELTPFERDRLDMRQYKVVPSPEFQAAERARREQQLLEAIKRQTSSASGGFAPNEPPVRPDFKAQLESLKERARRLKNESVPAPVDFNKISRTLI